MSSYRSPSEPSGSPKVRRINLGGPSESGGGYIGSGSLNPGGGSSYLSSTGEAGGSGIRTRDEPSGIPGSSFGSGGGAQVSAGEEIIYVVVPRGNMFYSGNHAELVVGEGTVRLGRGRDQVDELGAGNIASFVPTQYTPTVICGSRVTMSPQFRGTGDAANYRLHSWQVTAGSHLRPMPNEVGSVLGRERSSTGRGRGTSWEVSSSETGCTVTVLLVSHTH